LKNHHTTIPSRDAFLKNHHATVSSRDALLKNRHTTISSRDALKAGTPPIPACDYSALSSSEVYPEILPASLVRRLWDFWFFTAMASAFGSPMTTTSFLPRVTAV